MSRIVIAGACRTAIGTMGGYFSDIPAKDLGTIVIKEAVKRAGIKPEDVDQVIMGCVLQAGQGQNVARQASIHAGLPIETPAMTVNILCGSGLECVNLAADYIKAGEADVVIAGGMENMTRAPYLVTQGRYGYRMNNAVLYDSMIRMPIFHVDLILEQLRFYSSFIVIHMIFIVNKEVFTASTNYDTWNCYSFGWNSYIFN